MIKYINNLYLTDKSEKRIDKIKNDISEKRFLSLACIIIISENHDDVFDIIPVNNLKFRVDENYDFTVLGIAENKRSAMRLCKLMIEEYMSKNSDKTMRDYFKDKI